MNSMIYPSAMQILGRALAGGIASHVIWFIIYSLTLRMSNGDPYPGYAIIGMGLVLGLFFAYVTGSVLVIATGVIRHEKYETAITYFSTCVMLAVFFFYMRLMSPTWWHLLLNVVIGIIGAWILTHWVLDLPYSREKRKISY